MFPVPIRRPSSGAPPTPSFDDYIDMYSTLNHDLHTIPVDTQKQRVYFDSKNPSYSMTRKAVQICNRSDEIKRNCAKNSQFTYKIFQINYSIYPEMRMKHILFNASLESISSNLLLRMPSIQSYLRGFYKWGNNYFHFITECLPSILFLNQQLSPNAFPILCHASAFCRPLLQFMEVNNPVVHQIPPNMDVCYEQVYVECGNPSPEKIRLLRDVIEKKVVFEPSIGILIHRKETIRSIRNHDQVLDLLKTVYPDMEWRVFGSESIADTVELFRKAKLIVAPHGAGTTNMIFSAAGIEVIEFMPVDSPNLCYWHLAEALGNSYRIIACDSVDHQMTVDIAETKRILLEHVDAQKN